MAGDLRPPDFARPCQPFEPHYLETDQLLCRIYNREKADAGRYNCLDWNFTIPTMSRRDGGRFDATAAEPHGYLYGAEAHDSVDIAVLETIIPLADYDSTRQRSVISRAELSARAIQWFTCSKPVTLASLYTVSGRASLNAPEEVCSCPDRHLTREWGRYFRQCAARDAQGLAYNSTQEGAKLSERSFVLWEDRMFGITFHPSRAEVSFASFLGRRLISSVLDSHDIQLI